MNLKKTAFGLVSAGALTFGLALGAAAQVETVPSEVTLLEGFCTIATSVEDDEDNVDFGDWVYDPSGAGSWIPGVGATDAIDLTIADSGAGNSFEPCNVTVQGNSLREYTATGSPRVPVTLTWETEQATSESEEMPVPAVINITVPQAGSEDVTVSIPSSIDGDLVPETYEGSVVVTNNSADD